MANLMRQDGFKFLLAHLLHERVKQRNSPALAQPGKKGVRMLGALAAVHHLDAGVDKSGALGQVFQPVFQRAFRQRRELVEQGKNENWRQHAHQQLKNHDHTPRPQPPIIAACPDQPKYQRQQRHADGKTQRDPLDLIRPPSALRRVVEPKLLLKSKLRPP